MVGNAGRGTPQIGIALTTESSNDSIETEAVDAALEEIDEIELAFR